MLSFSIEGWSCRSALEKKLASSPGLRFQGCKVRFRLAVAAAQEQLL